MNSEILIGVDLGGTNMRAGRLENGVLLDSATQPTPAKEAEGVVLEQLCATIDQVLTPGVRGIGIGVPSVVDVEQGIVYSVENIPSWQEVHLKQILEARYRVPVQVNNDANCFALGEFHFGQGRGFRHVVGMAVGTGLGMGVILNGHLYSGANCGAGEMGCIPYRDKNFEYYASGQRFARELGENGAVIHARALRGDPEALRVFKEFGHDFGQVIMTTLYAFDPQLILLGGSVSKSYDLYRDAMFEALQVFAYPHVLSRLQIRVSEEPHVAILGAAALCLD